MNIGSIISVNLLVLVVLFFGLFWLLRRKK